MPKFLPMGQVTGIGSLPHLNAEAAVRFVAEWSPVIPFWPQLPKRSVAEGMIMQMLVPLSDLLIIHNPARVEVKAGQEETFRRRLSSCAAMLEPHRAVGFTAFERACESHQFPKAQGLKGQMTGPITLAQCVFVEGYPLVAMPEFHAPFVDYLCRLGVWQVERLRRFDLPVLLFIDEPCLGMASVRELEHLHQLITSLSAAGADVGIHCCASKLPDAICELGADIISLDSYAGLETFLAQPPVHHFVAVGGSLAFGIVPTRDDLDDFAPSEAFVRLLAAAEENFDLYQLVSQCLITATCGLGLMTMDHAQKSFTKCGELTQLLHKVILAIERA